MFCITLPQQNADTKYFGQEVRGGFIAILQDWSSSEVFSQQDTIISPTMLMSVILKALNLNNL
jgi:hypothetical protein